MENVPDFAGVLVHLGTRWVSGCCLLICLFMVLSPAVLVVLPVINVVTRKEKAG